MMNEFAQKNIDKGGALEEALRQYFLGMGAFVIRGVPFKQGKEDITDIDLWVYTRANVHARHVSIVDIKNKKRAKAFERIVWVKGLQAAVGADDAVVATTSSVDAVAPFAKRLGVKLLSKGSLAPIQARYGNAIRLSNEDILERWRNVNIRGTETLKSRLLTSLAELSTGITFAALNIWVDDAAELFALSIDRERKPGELARAAYFFSALVAIAADYLGKGEVFSEPEVRRSFFKNGLLFGRPDPDASKKFTDFAEQLVTEYLDQSGASAARIRSGFERSLENLSINSLVEFFSKPAAGRELVDGAIALEAASFSPGLPQPSELSREARTIIGLILDYADLPRAHFLGAGKEADREARPRPIAEEGDKPVTMEFPFDKSPK
ncbi:glycosyltransferase family protein [Rhizobium ruizarguesonis]|uniref:hypothetical protein n=1 Tax=Rhizobium ruizarguesonis TaxID=2081791 RepID=UPI0010316EFD|nr:hypothetical protein [Rhizobium ruizarguesonis]